MTNKLLTIVFINKNGGAVFEKALKAAQQLSSRILVVDSGSTDESKSYADEVQAQWVEREWPGDFSNQRNFAQSLVNTEWVLFLDSDEILEKKLILNISKTLNNQPDKEVAFQFFRKNLLLGHRLRFGSMSSDSILRLYRPTEAHWEGCVHEKLVPFKGKKLQITTIKGFAIHHSYESFEDWFKKSENYTSLWASLNKNKKCTASTIIFKTLFAFIKSYFFQLGILDGRWGGISSFLHSAYTFKKYAKLYDLIKKDETFTHRVG